MTKCVRYISGFQNQIRNLPVVNSLISDIEHGISTVYGAKAHCLIYSGGQPAKGSKGKRTGSQRHDNGRAADLFIYISGKKIKGLDLARFGQWWLANKKGSCGLEMNSGGIHVDNWKTPRTIGGGLLWTYEYSNNQPWGAAARQMLENGRKGIRPPKKYDLPVLSEPFLANEFVRAIQKLLIGQGYDLSSDGLEGPKTEQAIIDWQEANGFHANGIMTNKQLAKLRVGPVNIKPLLKSRINAGATVAGSAGIASAAQEIGEITSKIEEQQLALSTWDFLPFVISVIIISGAVYALYARWSDAGKPNPFKRS